MREDREEATASIWVKNNAVWTIMRAAEKDIKELQYILKGECKGAAGRLHVGGESQGERKKQVHKWPYKMNMIKK